MGRGRGSVSLLASSVSSKPAGKRCAWSPRPASPDGLAGFGVDVGLPGRPFPSDHVVEHFVHLLVGQQLLGQKELSSCAQDGFTLQADRQIHTMSQPLVPMMNHRNASDHDEWLPHLIMHLANRIEAGFFITRKQERRGRGRSGMSGRGR